MGASSDLWEVEAGLPVRAHLLGERRQVGGALVFRAQLVPCRSFPLARGSRSAVGQAAGLVALAYVVPGLTWAQSPLTLTIWRKVWITSTRSLDWSMTVSMSL